MALWEAQLDTVCCLHSWDGESQEVQGLSWKLGDHLGKFDLWSKSKHVFIASIICISCLNYLVGLSLCSRQEWVILLPKKRARKYVYYILISYGHLEPLLHPAGSKYRWNSSLCELKTAAITTATQNLDKFFARLRQKHLDRGRGGNRSSMLVLKVPSSLNVCVVHVPTGLPAARPWCIWSQLEFCSQLCQIQGFTPVFSTMNHWKSKDQKMSSRLVKMLKATTKRGDACGFSQRGSKWPSKGVMIRPQEKTHPILCCAHA